MLYIYIYHLTAKRYLMMLNVPLSHGSEYIPLTRCVTLINIIPLSNKIKSFFLIIFFPKFHSHFKWSSIKPNRLKWRRQTLLKVILHQFGMNIFPPENSIWNTVVPLLNYSCMFQVEICSQQLEICKSVCMVFVLPLLWRLINFRLFFSDDCRSLYLVKKIWSDDCRSSKDKRVCSICVSIISLFETWWSKVYIYFYVDMFYWYIL